MTVHAVDHDHEIPVNRKNWVRYQSISHQLAATLIGELILNLPEGNVAKISRIEVRDYFRQDVRLGIVAAIVWGYPRGTFPGGRSFEPILSEIDQISKVIDSFKLNPLTSAAEICSSFEKFRGLGPSTYTKFLYFAEIETIEGECLIYDQRVMRSISMSSAPEWASIKRNLGQCYKENGKFKTFTSAAQVETYPSFIATAKRMSDSHRSADKIEFDLFNDAPTGRS